MFGLFMYGFDGDDIPVFDTKYDACAYSVLTPYPGTLTWYEMKKANRIVSFDWEKYDQGHVVFRPAQMSGDELRLGQSRTHETSGRIIKAAEAALAAKNYVSPR